MSMNILNESPNGASGNCEGERKAEKQSRKPANRLKRKRLIEIVRTNILIARGHAPESSRIEPVGQLEEFIDRVSRRAGGQTPLFEIQGDPTGKGFISQVPPRKHEAEHRYGFQFGHAREQEKSWWWIILDESGYGPLLVDVELAPGNGALEPQTPPKTLKGIQSSMFGTETRTAIGAIGL